MLRISVKAQYRRKESPSVNETERSKAVDHTEVEDAVRKLRELVDEDPDRVVRIVEVLVELEGQAAYDCFEAAYLWAVSGAAGLRFDEVEIEIVEKRGPEILRSILQAHVDRRGTGDAGSAIRLVEKRPEKGDDADGECIEAGGQILNHRRERTRTINTTVGPVIVRRQTYGQRGLYSVAPLDGEMNLPSRGFSHMLSRRTVTQAARAPYEETGRTLKEMTGQRVSMASMLSLVAEAAADFEAFYRQRERGTSECALLVATVDGKGVPMRREAEKSGHGKRRRKGEKANRKKMATVAVVYEIDPYHRTVDEILGMTEVARGPRLVRTERPRPENKRAWASLSFGMDKMFGLVRDEMRRRDPQHRKRLFRIPCGYIGVMCRSDRGRGGRSGSRSRCESACDS